MKVQDCSLATMLLIAITFGGIQQAQAQPQLRLFRPAKNSAQSMELTEKVGPWLIMCYSFSGEDGVQQARRLAAELRETYNLDAYTYTHRFDLTQKIQAHTRPTKKYIRDRSGEIVLGRDGKPMLVDPKLTTASDSNIAETAVLIGSFDSVEDERAQKYLAKIKTLAPKTLAGGNPDALANDDDLAGGKLRFWRDSINQTLAQQIPGMQVNALRNAFLIPNPMLPEEYFVANSIDKWIIDMNRKVRFSLLDCPGSYSVRVATFRGKTVINQGEIKRLVDDLNYRKRTNQGIDSPLDECANKANELVKALRKEGVEAYEFHDREESYVCVGSFDWLKRTDGAGNEYQNPAVRETILKYRGNVTYRGGQPVAIGVPVPKSLRNVPDGDKIAYDMQPLPVVVPKAPKSRTAKFLSKLKLR